MTREFSREEYSVRITWLIWGRVVLTTFLVGTLVFFQQRYKIYSFHNAVLYYVLLSVYVLTALYRYLLGRFQNLLFLAYLQTSIDILLITFLVLVTGGIDSGLSILYHLTIISASIILYRRGGYLAASLSSILYGAMLDMQYYNVLNLVRSQNFTAEQVFYQVFINILSFYFVALLSGYLSERLRTTRQELQEKSIDFEDLRVMQEHILRSVGSGILTIDLQGNITSLNPAAELITGYSNAELKQHWQDIFGNNIKELFGHTDSLKERPYRFNGHVVKKDNTTALLGLTASLLKDDVNTVRGIILTFQDITKLVEMEDQVRRQERLATVGSLAAGIAHEIRNPLASLSGSIQLLQSELELRGDDKRLMDIVVRETDRLNTIITDFLEYARPKTAQEEQIELCPVLDETIMLLKNSKNFNERIRIISDVDTRIRLKGDAQRLRQVFWNLLINACQAMPTGGSIMITAASYSHGDDTGWCHIAFSDTGQGIAREFQDKIFDPFFTTKADGTGLGLAIVYRIIEDHDGTILVESNAGKGTCFTIRLPLFEETAFAPNLNGKARADA
ncbi:MAG: two-component system sensor histidine kinase NtrB [Betaproteobacteria bacterium]